MLSVEERQVWYNSKLRHFVIYPFCDFKMLCFYLAISWFGGAYIAMENGRNLTEKFWEEIIMNRQLNRDFRFLLTETRQTCIL